MLRCGTVEEGGQLKSLTVSWELGTFLKPFTYE